jgi:hypothetical protein
MGGTGMHVVVSRPETRRSNIILLSESSQLLMRDLFRDPTLFLDAPRIRKRVVAWGYGKDSVEMPHAAVVISEDELLEKLWARVPNYRAAPIRIVDWEVAASRDSAHFGEDYTFGEHVASVHEAVLRSGVEPESCWMESVSDGWLFLFSLGGQRARLISVGSPAEELLMQSRLIQGSIELLIGEAAKFPSYPRISSQLCGANWLACGSAAMALDPICGEGAGTAVREAILASAVIRATMRGWPAEDLLDHYTSRLRQGFLRHLMMCRDFYEAGGTQPFWIKAADMLRDGIRIYQQQPAGRPRFRLVDFDLQLL